MIISLWVGQYQAATFMSVLSWLVPLAACHLDDALLLVVVFKKAGMVRKLFDILKSKDGTFVSANGCSKKGKQVFNARVPVEAQ